MLPRRAFLAALTAFPIMLMAPSAACGWAGGDEGSAGEDAPRLRLGYFPNVTHGIPLAGLANGVFAEELDGVARLEPKLFNAGPALIEALFAGEVDAAYVGPNPAINAYVRSQGEAARVIAGAAVGGSALVVRPGAGIESPEDFAGKTIATPQLANTQDVALRSWLGDHNLRAREQGGNVWVVPMSNGDAFAQFRRGTVDGAWVAEPWVSRLVIEAGGQVFVDERDLWPGGKFATTLLIVRPGYLERHPAAVEALLRAHLDTIDWVVTNGSEAKALVNAEIVRLTSAALPPEIIDAAWETITFTPDPVAASIYESAAHAFELGFLGVHEPDIEPLFALDLLRALLTERGLPPVEVPS